MLEHPWKVDTATAKRIQSTLVESIHIEEFIDPIRMIAGADVTVTIDRQNLIGGFVVFSWPDLEPVSKSIASQEATFPYIPGLLSFREIPVLISAWSQLDIKPDLIFCDGQGIAHPRRLGLASHVGLLLKCPSIGCAKSRLVGEYDDVPSTRGSWRPLMYNGALVGSVLRTRSNVKPVFVSPGHRVGIDQSRELVLAACTKYRLPEPIRAAHRLVNDHRRIIGQP